MTWKRDGPCAGFLFHCYYCYSRPYLQRLTPAERKALEAEALARAGPEARQSYEEAAPARFRASVLLGLVREHVAQELGRGAIPAG